MSTTETTTVLDENDVRAFQMCPRYFRFGGTNVFPDITKLLKLTTEKALSDSIRHDRLDPSMKYMKALIKSSKELELQERYMEGQVQEMHNKVGLALGELFSSFAANDYLPVFGPAPWRVHVSRSTIQICISGILKADPHALHIVDFSPYQTLHGLRNDPIIYLKAKTLMQFVQPWFTGPTQCVLHVFGINEKEKLLYHRVNSENMSQIALERIQRTIRAIEEGIDFPVLPCSRACPYKTKCSLEIS
jgi:hypothetical protein